MINYLDSFVDSLTAEDFIKAYPGSLEFIADDPNGLQACKYLQKHCSGIYLYFGGVTKFDDKLRDFLKGKNHVIKKIAMDMKVSEGTLMKLLRQIEPKQGENLFYSR